MPVEQQRGQDRRQRILDAALQVFSHKGYRDAAVDEIAVESATSKGGVYFHFPNKQAIFVALLDRMAALLLDRMESAAQAERDPAGRLDAALRTVFQTFASHRTLARLFLVEAMGAGREFDARMVDVQNAFAAVIRKHLDEAVAQGVIAPHDTDVTGVAWFGAVNQVVTRWIVTGRPRDLDDAYQPVRALLLRSVGLDAPGPTREVDAASSRRDATTSAAALGGTDSNVERLRANLQRLAEGRSPTVPTLLSGSERLAWRDPLALLEAAQAQRLDRGYWQDLSSPFSAACAGTAWVIESEVAGLDRFAAVSRAWTELLATAQLDRVEAVGTGPILFGGFAFDPTGYDGGMEGAGLPKGISADQAMEHLPRAVGDSGAQDPALRRGTSMDPIRTHGLPAAGEAMVRDQASTARTIGPDRRLGPDWRGFPAARFVLPEMMLMSTGDESWLTVNVIVGPSDDPETAVAAALDRWRTLQAAAPSHAIERAPAQMTLEDVDFAERWKDAVGEATGAIRRGELEKVVLARAVTARSTRVLDPARSLRQLRAAYAGRGVLFAFAWGGKEFIGATPERLVRLRHGDVQTDALAGSTARGQTSEDDWQLGATLLASPKNQIEHAVVVRFLREALEESGVVDLAAPALPGLRKLSNVQHLFTPLTGHLPSGSVLDVVAHLHPTPAVGGFPRDEALRYLRGHEALDRGWYAGPVGWVDQHGEGEFAVAIRSALIASAGAVLFAGCGIVADSEPEAEYAESCWKLRPMIAALEGN